MPTPRPRPIGRLRILVVDADDRVRESLTGLLAIGDQLHGRRQLPASRARALDLAAEHRPDVVIVDPRLPEVDGGLAFIAGLRASLPGRAHPGHELVGRARAAGHRRRRRTASSARPSDPTELIAAIVGGRARPADA